MKNFSLLATLTVSVFLTSCEQEKISPETIIEPELSGNLVEEDANTIPDFNAIPTVSSIPEVSKETIDQLETATERSGCLEYNGPNFFPQIGLIYAFEAPVTWVWSYKYNDWIYLYNEDHLCESFVYFHTNNPICGQRGMMADNNESDGVLWNWTCKNGKTDESGWRTYRTVNCGGLGWVDPVPQSNLLSSEYGCRDLGPGKGDGFHSGIDFGGPVSGQPVKAVAAGKVIRSRSSYGEVAIDHGNYITRYLHMRNRIPNNTFVSAGQKIGTVSGIDGAGNDTYDDHLHFDYFSTNNYPSNSDNESQNPSVVICHISNLGVSQVDTKENGRISINQFCEKLGVTR